MSQPLEKPDPPVIDEAQLVAGLRAGAPAAYEMLVRVYGPRLLVTARRFFRDEGEAQDTLQER